MDVCCAVCDSGLASPDSNTMRLHRRASVGDAGSAMAGVAVEDIFCDATAADDSCT
jgi:hypothetical protein